VDEIEPSRTASTCLVISVMFETLPALRIPYPRTMRRPPIGNS
jgi:hypothetical protein